MLPRVSFLSFLLWAQIAWSSCPVLTNHFDTPTLSLLKIATNLRVIYDEANSLEEFKVRILYSPTHGKFVVMLGEMHYKTEAASNVGKNILLRFPLRGMEGMPANEYNLLPQQRKNSMVDSTEMFLQQMSQLTQQSIVNDAVAQGIDTDSQGNVLVYGQMQNWRVSGPSFQEPYINVHLEYGEFINPNSYSDVNKYINDARNSRMIFHILKSLTTFSPKTMLILMGIGHVDSIATQLTSQQNFTLCKL
jgi:hypothetical protein